jgi:hypothetical protein
VKTIQINLYEFSELETTGQQKALNDLHDINVNFDWYEMVFYDFQAIVRTLGMSVITSNIHFSGFYSQGDGSAFKANINLPELLEAVKIQNWKTHAPNLPLDLPVFDADPRILQLIKGDYISVEPEIIQPTSSYYVRAELNYEFPHTHRNYDRLTGELEKMEHWLQEVADRLNRYLYKALQDDYEYQTGEPAVTEAIDANGYFFTADGKIATRLTKLAGEPAH